MRPSISLRALSLLAPLAAAVLAGCPGSTNPYSPFAVPTALPSPILGYGLTTFTLDGTPRRYERAVVYSPGALRLAVRPDEIGAQQRKDLFPDEIAGEAVTFKLELPGATAGSVDGATMELTDKRTEPAVTYKGPVTVFLQDAGRRRGQPVTGTFAGTLTHGESGRTVAVQGGQFYGYLATDL